MSKHKNDSVAVTDLTILNLIAEIADLVKIRNALAFGSKTGLVSSAEGVMSRRINKRVMELSQQIINVFGKDD